MGIRLKEPDAGDRMDWETFVESFLNFDDLTIGLIIGFGVMWMFSFTMLFNAMLDTRLQRKLKKKKEQQ